MVMSFTAAVLILFTLAIAAAGFYNLRRLRSADEFLVAGRRSSGVATGGSLAATILGGSSTLGLAGLAFDQGLSGSWWLLVGALGLFCLLFFIPVIKSQPTYTLPELIGGWYGKGVRRIASVLILAAWLGIVGAQANAAGRIMATFFVGGGRLWTLACGTFFILYTAAGGQLSVIRTDLVQILLVIAGLAGCSLLGLGAVGGVSRLSAGLPPGHLSFPFSPNLSPGRLSLLILVVGATYLIGPDMLSRVFCSRSVAAARRGIVYTLLVIIPMAFVIALIGLEARVLFPNAAGEAAFPLMIKNILPPVLAALAITALLSAFLSSADTTLLTMSAIIAVDLMGLEKPKLGRLRLITLACGAASLLTGILSGGIIPALLLGYTVFSGGLFVPILAGLTGIGMSRPAAALCMICGGGLGLAGKLAGLDLLVAAGFAVSALVFAADRAIRASQPSRG
jgi:SSS family solute:Na+ symporter